MAVMRGERQFDGLSRVRILLIMQAKGYYATRTQQSATLGAILYGVRLLFCLGRCHARR
jgi:hypothetical protein